MPAVAEVAQSEPLESAPTRSESLLHPEHATLQAPSEFKVLFVTTQGEFVVAVHRDWAPIGVDRFFNLVSIGYYNDVAFHRAIQGFMIQFGLHGEPAVNKAWKTASIPDDPAAQSNLPGTISFAKTGAPHSRSVQLFINTGDNAVLDRMDFAPFGEVQTGMDTVGRLYTGYGEGAPRGTGPSQALINRRGNAFLREFPLLDYVKTATIVAH